MLQSNPVKSCPNLHYFPSECSASFEKVLPVKHVMKYALCFPYFSSLYTTNHGKHTCIRDYNNRVYVVLLHLSASIRLTGRFCDLL